jgi:hypothetical protein
LDCSARIKAVEGHLTDAVRRKQLRKAVRRNQKIKEPIMTTILIIVVVILLFGGGGYGYTRWRG